jgi:hypothetical protein
MAGNARDVHGSSLAYYLRTRKSVIRLQTAAARRSHDGRLTPRCRADAGRPDEGRMTSRVRSKRTMRMRSFLIAQGCEGTPGLGSKSGRKEEANAKKE